MKTERSDFGKTMVLSPTESNVKIEQVIYFKYKNMLRNISKLSSGAVRSKCNILYDFHELEGLPLRVHQDSLVSSSMLPLSSYPRHAQ